MGARPSNRPGATTSQSQAIASFGKLISASNVPARERSECRSGLDASSSMSPLRGSMTGLMPRLQRALHLVARPRGSLWSTSKVDRLSPQAQAEHDPPGAVQQKVDADDEAQCPPACDRPFAEYDKPSKDTDDARCQQQAAVPLPIFACQKKAHGPRCNQGGREGYRQQLRRSQRIDRKHGTADGVEQAQEKSQKERAPMRGPECVHNLKGASGKQRQSKYNGTGGFGGNDIG